MVDVVRTGWDGGRSPQTEARGRPGSAQKQGLGWRARAFVRDACAKWRGGLASALATALRSLELGQPQLQRTHHLRLYRLLLGRSASGSARRIEISPAHGAAVAFGAFGAGRCAGRANTRATAMVAQPPANRHSVSTGHRSCLSAEKSACTRQATPQQSENIRACAWYKHGEWLVGVE